MVLVVPEKWRARRKLPPVLLIDNTTPDCLYGATDRLVAQVDGDSFSRNALNIVDMAPRLESYIGNTFLLRLRKPLTEIEEERLWRFICSEYARNPGFDIWHLAGAGIRGACGSWFQNTEDWSAFFCSEFIVAALKVARRVPPEVNSTLYQPGSIEVLQTHSIRDRVNRLG